MITRAKQNISLYVCKLFSFLLSPFSNTKKNGISGIPENRKLNIRLPCYIQKFEDCKLLAKHVLDVNCKLKRKLLITFRNKFQFDAVNASSWKRFYKQCVKLLDLNVRQTLVLKFLRQTLDLLDSFSYLLSSAQT